MQRPDESEKERQARRDLMHRQEKTAATKRAIDHLRKARDALIYAGAERAAERVRRAISSAEGAWRHAIGLETRERSVLELIRAEEDRIR